MGVDESEDGEWCYGCGADMESCGCGYEDYYEEKGDGLLENTSAKRDQ